MTTFKRLLKTMMRPIARPYLRWLDRRVEVLIARNEDLAAWQRYLPVILNTIASQNAAARESRRSEEALRRRIDEVNARLDHIEARPDHPSRV